MANEVDEFELGYNGPSTGVDEWMTESSTTFSP